jgi:transcriptional regulator with XRE-family HTH domain
MAKRRQSENEGNTARLAARFSERLRYHRIQAGLNKADLRRLTGLDRHALIEFEAGRQQNPDLRQLLLLQRALGLDSIEDLLGNVEIKAAYPSSQYPIPAGKFTSVGPTDNPEAAQDR